MYCRSLLVKASASRVSSSVPVSEPVLDACRAPLSHRGATDPRRGPPPPPPPASTLNPTAPVTLSDLDPGPPSSPAGQRLPPAAPGPCGAPHDASPAPPRHEGLGETAGAPGSDPSPLAPPRGAPPARASQDVSTLTGESRGGNPRSQPPSPPPHQLPLVGGAGLTHC